MSEDKFKDKKQVYSLLREEARAVLSTVSPDGLPYASAIYYIVDEELNFYFLTKSDTKKAQNIEQNNNVAITVIHTSLPITVQSMGTAEETQDPEVYLKISEANAKGKGGALWPTPLTKLQSEGFLVMYKFQPTWLRVGDFSESKDITDIHRTIFHQIIPQK